jgi:Ca-activated chloride channel family protein
MWGQIEGKNKITIARSVLEQLLDDLPQSNRLGLMAYGHNKKGLPNNLWVKIQLKFDL